MRGIEWIVTGWWSCVCARWWEIHGTSSTILPGCFHIKLTDLCLSQWIGMKFKKKYISFYYIIFVGHYHWILILIVGSCYNGPWRSIEQVRHARLDFEQNVILGRLINAVRKNAVLQWKTENPIKTETELGEFTLLSHTRINYTAISGLCKRRRIVKCVVMGLCGAYLSSSWGRAFT